MYIWRLLSFGLVFQHIVRKLVINKKEIHRSLQVHTDTCVAGFLRGQPSPSSAVVSQAGEITEAKDTAPWHRPICVRGPNVDPK